MSYLFSDDSTPEIKTIMNYLTLSKTIAVEVKFANIGLGMYLIPLFLSTTVNYVIIGLQFNNII